MAGKKKDLCLACGKTFGKDAAIMCIICGLWVHHKPCSGISDEHFKFMDEQMRMTGTSYWACRPCTAYSQGITQKVKGLEKELDQVKADVKGNTDGVKRVEDSVEELKKIVEKNRKDIEEAVKATERRMGAEWREREIRRKNLVLHRVQEAGPDVATGEGRRKFDLDQVEKILGEMDLREEMREVKACRRVGERGEEARPMIVVMRNEETKRRVIESAMALVGTDWEHVTVVPDLTQMQRREEEEMRQEVERKNREELTQEDLSKNLVWTVVGARGEKRIIKTVERGRGGMRPARGATRGTRGRPPLTRGGRTGRGPTASQDQPYHDHRQGNKRTRDAAEDQMQGTEDEKKGNPSKR